jgi:hypothetical protein
MTNSTKSTELRGFYAPIPTRIIDVTMLDVIMSDLLRMGAVLSRWS